MLKWSKNIAFCWHLSTVDSLKFWHPNNYYSWACVYYVPKFAYGGGCVTIKSK